MGGGEFNSCVYIYDSFGLLWHSIGWSEWVIIDKSE